MNNDSRNEEPDIADIPPVEKGYVMGILGVREVSYIPYQGLALVEGDICIGTVEAQRALTKKIAECQEDGFGPVYEAIGISGNYYRWPGAIIPYEIDPAVPNKQRITAAIDYWQNFTRIRFPVRTNQTDYVRFGVGNVNFSSVGRIGGLQTILITNAATYGNVMHEIGHTVGLWHEQSRQDRNTFVTINYGNIIAGYESAFDQHIYDGDDLGSYDYGSIMHYGRTAFSRNGDETVTPINPSTAQIGQRVRLSAGDIAGVATLYP